MVDYSGPLTQHLQWDKVLVIRKLEVSTMKRRLVQIILSVSFGIGKEMEEKVGFLGMCKCVCVLFVQRRVSLMGQINDIKEGEGMIDGEFQQNKLRAKQRNK